MNCPECKALIKQENVGWSMDEEYDYIEIDVECGECHKNFFTRIFPKDLVLCDDQKSTATSIPGPDHSALVETEGLKA